MDNNRSGGMNAGVAILAGVDLCRPDRIKRVIARHGERFLRRVFTEGEIAYCSARGAPYRSYAARFAAKEAAMKILGEGLGRVGFSNVEVVNRESGKPYLKFHGRAKERAERLGVFSTDLALSHEKDLSIAMAVALARKRPESE